MRYVNQDRACPSDEHLHLADLPRWPELLLLTLATCAALGLLYALSQFIENRAEAIAASALVRGVPPASVPVPPAAGQAAANTAG